ncbi:MAG: dienelactone hydrolase family protein [Patescibacteria group bacterium]|nr:dienelactone hydrolase family protein [Patescibacteria group bacterium]
MTEIHIPIEDIVLKGNLVVPVKSQGLVIFSHGSGSGRLSPRNNYVADVLNEAKIGTLLLDLLTEIEDENYDNRFNIDLLTDRLLSAVVWSKKNPETQNLKIGLFGASTGAASALRVAANLEKKIAAVVSRGGRPDLAMEILNQVKSPTLLIVGGEDDIVIGLNEMAYEKLTAEKNLIIIPGATHLFEEPDTLEEVAKLAKNWFLKYF